MTGGCQGRSTTSLPVTSSSSWHSKQGAPDLVLVREDGFEYDGGWLGSGGGEYADGMLELSYRRHRFPPVVIQHAVWFYLRFTLSYRDVEELLAERGLDISCDPGRAARVWNGAGL
jgi:hypothetical protein